MILVVIVIFRQDGYTQNNLVAENGQDQDSYPEGEEDEKQTMPECEYPVQVGDECGGGTVFYVGSQFGGEGTNALIAYEEDEDERLMWGFHGENIQGADNTTYGYENTKILSEKGSPIATLCWDKTSYGYDDWYLPASRELFEIRRNSNEVGSDVLDGFVPFRYWSSTHADPENAMSVYFEFNQIARFNKRAEARARCIRSVSLD
ncbi:DUF1566 domain-containing protein [Candidatus Absconditicoccus praedator]|uniref:Lcl C-terminal domain-containing protein n=1 Tax=Candidatus Absconditicoccus praedator TaxID=2735562 RepID=UPI001E5D3FCB|nr:DUF1566 domain-containing protein [Candidatus Absconditicoccus praedator]UFX83170.1 DUF1566 domain-containing protein [Candidatus Absconditicoccus praedator]